MSVGSFFLKVFCTEEERKRRSRKKLDEIYKIAESVAFKNGYGLLKLASHDYWRTIQPTGGSRGLGSDETMKFKILLENEIKETGLDKDYIIIMIENYSAVDIHEFPDSMCPNQEIYTIEIRLRVPYTSK